MKNGFISTIQKWKRSWMLNLRIVFLISIIHTTCAKSNDQRLLIVEGSNVFSRENIQQLSPQASSSYKKHFPSAIMDNVIISAFDKKRIYTKDNFYSSSPQNAKSDFAYETFLTEGKGSISDLDSIYVTSPPARTTLAPKRAGWNDLPQLKTIEESKKFKDESNLKTTATRQIPQLKLVTIPPAPSKKVIPPKVTISPYNAERNQAIENIVRFPAQPWQIPPFNLPKTPNLLSQWFSSTLAPFVPPNPFYPQLITTPPPRPFIEEKSINDAYDPYTRGNAKSSSKSERIIQLGKGMKPIPLPTNAQIDSQYNNGFERDLIGNNKKRGSFVEKTPYDFSIDSTPTTSIQKTTDVAFIPQKSVENGSTGRSIQQIKKFAHVHPNFAEHFQRYQVKEVASPKWNATQPNYPGVPIRPETVKSTYYSTMSPNQKLDICCRKQNVGPQCQLLCNFDTFNDKSLVTAFLTNQCPGPQLGQAYDCASSKADHSECCERGGLFAFQGGKCIPFCRTNVATPANVLDYFVCLQVFDTIKNCYRDYQLSHPNIFGD